MADENKTPETEKAPEIVTVDSVYKGYAEKATDAKPHIVSLTDKFDMEFVKDFGEFKKGDKATVSMVAKDFYLANKAAKLAKDSE